MRPTRPIRPTPPCLPATVLRYRRIGLPLLPAALAAALALPWGAQAQPVAPALVGLAAPQPLDAARWSLVGLILAAHASHPALRSQQALLGAAEAGVESARWQYFPTPSLSVQAAGTGQGDAQYAGDRSVTVLALSQPLWTWGRLDAAQDKALAQRDAARASHAEAGLGLALRLVQTWGEWQAAQARLEAYEAGLRHHERLLHQVQRRLDEGQAAASDLGLAEGRLAALRADAAQAGLQEAAARERLAVLSGQPLARGALALQPESALPAEPQAPAPASDWLERVAQASPALARLQAQLRQQQAVVAELQARLKPELSARLESQHGNFSVAGTATRTRALVALNTQLGAGLSSVTAVTEALRRAESAQAEIGVQRLALAEQVATDRELLLAAPQRRADLVRAIGASNEVLRSWDRQYLAGRKTWQDLMGAAREQVQARVQLAEFDAARLVAAWRLSLLAGGLDSTLQEAQS
jgi:outer membrane protein, adhesin transport system